MKENLEIFLLKHESAQDLPVPQYATEGSSGMDLYANVQEPVILEKYSRKLIPTGISVALPKGVEVQIRPRSGLAFKNGVTVLNTPGTVDSDYRGEIMVILCNFSEQSFVVERGMRIAQMIVAPVLHPKINIVNSLDNTDRGVGGFGSTGVR